MLKDNIFKALAKKQDCVIVGSMALWLHGVSQDSPNDVDLVVTSLQDLPNNLICYDTDSAFSVSGKRAFRDERHGVKLDIFIEDTLPDWVEIKGFKVQTIASMLAYYKRILPNVKEFWRPFIINKINILSSWMEKI